jgi:hypothetical protein
MTTENSKTVIRVHDPKGINFNLGLTPSLFCLSRLIRTRNGEYVVMLIMS